VRLSRRVSSWRVGASAGRRGGSAGTGARRSGRAVAVDARAARRSRAEARWRLDGRWSARMLRALSRRRRGAVVGRLLGSGWPAGWLGCRSGKMRSRSTSTVSVGLLAWALGCTQGGVGRPTQRGWAERARLRGWPAALSRLGVVSRADARRPERVRPGSAQGAASVVQARAGQERCSWRLGAVAGALGRRSGSPGGARRWGRREEKGAGGWAAAQGEGRCAPSAQGREAPAAGKIKIWL
jgi:hypothetical protein